MAGHGSAIVTKDIRQKLLGGLMTVRWSHFVHLKIGEMTNLITGEPDRIGYAFPALVS